MRAAISTGRFAIRLILVLDFRYNPAEIKNAKAIPIPPSRGIFPEWIFLAFV